MKYGYTSDLLSDVIANAQENGVWITVQRHINILGVAKVKNIVAIITPRSLKVDKELIERARAEEAGAPAERPGLRSKRGVCCTGC